ncbi:MAG: hypothetical protein ACRDH8_04045 [Actinomycetota bacterium]
MFEEPFVLGFFGEIFFSAILVTPLRVSRFLTPSLVLKVGSRL